VSGAAPGELCGVCAAPLRAGARFCGRCGGQQGLMVPREAGVGDELPPAAKDAVRPLRGRGLVVAIAGYFAMFVPMMVLIARKSVPMADELATVELLGGAIGLAGLVVLGRDALRTLVPRLPPARVAVGALLATAALAATITVVARAVPSWFITLDDALGLAGMSAAMALVYAALVPTVSEELLFRGAVLGGLTDVMTDRTAIVTSALLFAIVHLSVPSMLHLTALGLVLGWVRLRSGSVWPAIALHAAYNAAVLLAG
jgi:membrane protease YdiL (CAAX protease family)